ncbi:hypothetical protein PROFUN_05234 [Planoprotostelium fungivorum]|uniref:Uncharacterized protein n=1 Tax=Planoprotostelium fungivorum TaxID=1890364 RepID=A0A2P6NRL9_9EUKA|nr:hypothetical protein PROFUN_05234 [Planoprotostelium fungivorum]
MDPRASFVTTLRTIVQSMIKCLILHSPITIGFRKATRIMENASQDHVVITVNALSFRLQRRKTSAVEEKHGDLDNLIEPLSATLNCNRSAYFSLFISNTRSAKMMASITQALLAELDEFGDDGGLGSNEVWQMQTSQGDLIQGPQFASIQQPIQNGSNGIRPSSWQPSQEMRSISHAQEPNIPMFHSIDFEHRSQSVPVFHSESFDATDDLMSSLADSQRLLDSISCLELDPLASLPTQTYSTSQRHDRPPSIVQDSSPPSSISDLTGSENFSPQSDMLLMAEYTQAAAVPTPPAVARHRSVSVSGRSSPLQSGRDSPSGRLSPLPRPASPINKTKPMRPTAHKPKATRHDYASLINTGITQGRGVMRVPSHNATVVRPTPMPPSTEDNGYTRERAHSLPGFYNNWEGSVKEYQTGEGCTAMHMYNENGTM